MTTFDYIFLAILAVSLVIGIIRGLFKQVAFVGGIVVVLLLVNSVAPLMEKLFSLFIADQQLMGLVSWLTAAVVLGLLYALIVGLLHRLAHKAPVLGKIDHLLGGVVAIVIVYLVFAVVISLCKNVNVLSSAVGDFFSSSWIVQNVYKNNFFGDWVVRSVAESVLDNLGENATITIGNYTNLI